MSHETTAWTFGSDAQEEDGISGCNDLQTRSVYIWTVEGLMPAEDIADTDIRNSILEYRMNKSVWALQVVLTHHCADGLRYHGRLSSTTAPLSSPSSSTLQDISRASSDTRASGRTKKYSSC